MKSLVFCLVGFLFCNFSWAQQPEQSDQLEPALSAEQATRSLDSIMALVYGQNELVLGKKLPPAVLEMLDGQPFDIDTLRGKPSIILFWSVTCQPCLDLIPMMLSLKHRYGPEVNIVALTSLAPEVISQYLDLHDFDVIHLVNAQSYMKRLGIITLPRVFVNDQTLTVLEVFDKRSMAVGLYLLEKKIRDVIQRIL